MVGGTDVRRPRGQRLTAGQDPLFGPTSRLDFELEVGFVIGRGNVHGNPIAAGEAEETVFEMCLVNDWPTRDIQAGEYRPLGPFLSKSFVTSMSPWVVQLDSLAPYRVPAPV